jgi:hypothetical protein
MGGEPPNNHRARCNQQRYLFIIRSIHPESERKQQMLKPPSPLRFAYSPSPQDYMDIRRVDPAYRAHFGDHTTLDLLYDNERMRAQMDAVEAGLDQTLYPNP